MSGVVGWAFDEFFVAGLGPLLLGQAVLACLSDRRHQEEDVGRYDDRDERLRVLGRAVMQQWILAYESSALPSRRGRGD